MKTTLRNSILFVILAGFASTGCDSDDSPKVDKTQMELDQLKSATEKYHNVATAEADGYADIDLIMPNMGAHFLNADLLDDKFEVDKPEVLVYSPAADGKFILTAVEYAIPVDLSPNAPEGFTGSDDVWVINKDFNLWTLHAWIWYENPGGVFKATNSRVP